MKEKFKGIWQTISDWSWMIFRSNEDDPNAITQDLPDDNELVEDPSFKEKDNRSPSKPTKDSLNYSESLVTSEHIATGTEAQRQHAYLLYIDDD